MKSKYSTVPWIQKGIVYHHDVTGSRHVPPFFPFRSRRESVIVSIATLLAKKLVTVIGWSTVLIQSSFCCFGDTTYVFVCCFFFLLWFLLQWFCVESKRKEGAVKIRKKKRMSLQSCSHCRKKELLKSQLCGVKLSTRFISI